MDAGARRSGLDCPYLELAEGRGQGRNIHTPMSPTRRSFLGTLGGAVGFGLWTWALQRSTPSRVAVFLALNPITAIALGALLLGEPVTIRLLLGLAAVLAGIQLASRATPVSGGERAGRMATEPFTRRASAE